MLQCTSPKVKHDSIQMHPPPSHTPITAVMLIIVALSAVTHNIHFVSLSVVHEMNGEDGIHLLSAVEVDELIHKADEASMISQTSLPTAKVQEEEEAVEITGLESEVAAEPSMAEASVENPVTMVFMGYQSVEDEEETKKVLGLQGTVKAELVLIDNPDGKVSPGGGEGKKMAGPPGSATTTSLLLSSKPPETSASNRDRAIAEEVEEAVLEVKKEKQPCKCCSIM